MVLQAGGVLLQEDFLLGQLLQQPLALRRLRRHAARAGLRLGPLGPMHNNTVPIPHGGARNNTVPN
jgi:hypothetical protein